MARYSQSEETSKRVSDVISDPGSSLGSLLKHAKSLLKLQILIANNLESDLATQFQLASARGGRLVLVTPDASRATQLRMQSPMLLDKLRESGHTEFTRIDVRVAPLAVQNVEERRARPLSASAKQALENMDRLGSDDED